MDFTLTALFAAANTVVMTAIISYYTEDIKLTNCNCISYQGHHAPSSSITGEIRSVAADRSSSLSTEQTQLLERLTHTVHTLFTQERWSLSLSQSWMDGWIDR